MRTVDIITAVAIAITIVWFARTALARDRDAERFEEDDARTFFDEHGHWPDETPADADARARRAAVSERLARAEDRDV
mgnify:CR=1 FL=1